MGRIAFGSPEAMAVLEADKKLQEEKDKPPLSLYEVSFNLSGVYTITVEARSKDEATRNAEDFFYDCEEMKGVDITSLASVNPL